MTTYSNNDYIWYKMEGDNCVNKKYVYFRYIYYFYYNNNDNINILLLYIKFKYLIN